MWQAQAVWTGRAWPVACAKSYPTSLCGGTSAPVDMRGDKKPASETPWTRELWIYDFRTNLHFTLKQNPLKREHLDDFVRCFHASNRHARAESERSRRFSYEELAQREKLNLDVFWLKDESLGDTDKRTPPAEIAAEIVENLEAALEQFRSVAEELSAPALISG
jgi:type I restriction enzyme M protein